MSVLSKQDQQDKEPLIPLFSAGEVNALDDLSVGSYFSIPFQKDTSVIIYRVVLHAPKGRIICSVVTEGPYLDYVYALPAFLEVIEQFIVH